MWLESCAFRMKSIWNERNSSAVYKNTTKNLPLISNEQSWFNAWSSAGIVTEKTYAIRTLCHFPEHLSLVSVFNSTAENIPHPPVNKNKRVCALSSSITGSHLKEAWGTAGGESAQPLAGWLLACGRHIFASSNAICPTESQRHVTT